MISLVKLLLNWILDYFCAFLKQLFSISLSFWFSFFLESILYFTQTFVCLTEDNPPDSSLIYLSREFVSVANHFVIKYFIPKQFILELFSQGYGAREQKLPFIALWAVKFELNHCHQRCFWIINFFLFFVLNKKFILTPQFCYQNLFKVCSFYFPRFNFKEVSPYLLIIIPKWIDVV